MQLTIRNQNLPGVRMVACGGAHTVCLTNHRHVWTWGRGKDGQLGHGNRYAKKHPAIVRALMGKHICAVTAGDQHRCVRSPTYIQYLCCLEILLYSCRFTVLAFFISSAFGFDEICAAIYICPSPRFDAILPRYLLRSELLLAPCSYSSSLFVLSLLL